MSKQKIILAVIIVTFILLVTVFPVSKLKTNPLGVFEKQSTPSIITGKQNAPEVTQSAPGGRANSGVVQLETKQQEYTAPQKIAIAKTLTMTMASINNSRIKEKRVLSADETKSLLAISTKRKEEMQGLARKDPQAFLLTVMSGKDRSLYPAEIQKNIEVEKTVTARIEVFHMDDFTNPNNSTFNYSLIEKGSDSTKRIEFYPTNSVGLDGSSGAGVNVNIHGFLIGSVMVSSPAVGGGPSLQK